MGYKLRYIIFLFLVFIFSCQNPDNAESKKNDFNKIGSVLDTISVLNTSLKVSIPFSGYLESWRKETIETPDSARVISVLVESGQSIAANQQLLSLWKLNRNFEFTPMDVHAPFSGRVQEVYVGINQKIGSGSKLVSIYNNDYFKMKAYVKKYQTPLLKKGQYVFCKSVEQNFEGSILQVKSKSREINIKLFNPDQANLPQVLLNGEISIPVVKGSFIKSSYFKNRDYINVYVDEETVFKAFKVGISDTLSLLSTNLSSFSEISIIKSNI